MTAEARLASFGRPADWFAGLGTPLSTGWRWIPAAIGIGVLPFLVSWRLSARGHQLVSAVLLMVALLPCLRNKQWLKGLALIAVTYFAHCVSVVAAARVDPAGTAALLPGADDYWRKQLLWIQTGWDPEYEMSNWIWAHLQLLGATAVLSALSLGWITFYQGFREVDLMNYYVAQLLRASGRPAAVFAGWHLWSIFRGVGYAFLTVEILSLTLDWLARRKVQLHRARLAAGLFFLLLDGAAKQALLEPVRVVLEKCLTPSGGG